MIGDSLRYGSDNPDSLQSNSDGDEFLLRDIGLLGNCAFTLPQSKKMICM